MDINELVSRIAQFDADLVVFVEDTKSLSSRTRVVLLPLGQNDLPDSVPDGYRELLDVWQIRDVLAGKAALNEVAYPTHDQNLRWILEYCHRGA